MPPTWMQSMERVVTELSTTSNDVGFRQTLQQAIMHFIESLDRRYLSEDGSWEVDCTRTVLEDQRDWLDSDVKLITGLDVGKIFCGKEEVIKYFEKTYEEEMFGIACYIIPLLTIADRGRVTCHAEQFSHDDTTEMITKEVLVFIFDLNEKNKIGRIEIRLMEKTKIPGSPDDLFAMVDQAEEDKSKVVGLIDSRGID